MKNSMKNILFVFVLLSANAIGIFCCANFAHAADSNLIITEVMYDPVKNLSGEKINWIELYNPTNQNIDLVPGQRSKTAPISWKMKIKYYIDIDKLGIPKENNCTFTDAKTASLTPNEFLIISTKPESLSLDESIKTFKASSCFALSGDYQETTIALSNDYGQHWFAETTYSPSRGENDLGKSLEKKILTDENSWEPSCKDGGTPGEEPKICETETVSADEDNNATDSDEDTTNSPEKCTASSEDIKLNEIFPYPKSGNEFVEIINTGESCVDVSGWKIMDEASHKKEFPENSIIGPGEYFFLEGNLYLNNDSDAVYLLAADVDAKSEALDNVQYEKAKKDFSFGFDKGNWLWTSVPTPGYANVIAAENSGSGDADVGDNHPSSAENVYLNEILPNPKGGSDDEYIEIVNGESVPVDLMGWTLKDASKGKGYKFKEHVLINPDEYLVIYRPQSKIALNNSEESIYLYNAQGKITSNVSYGKSQKNASYSFDGKDWKWSKYLTPGKENKFDSLPTVKIKKIKHAYKDLYTEFSAKAKDKETKKLKYTWDFGDGKKSYLRVASHKYLATGKYTVTLSVSDESQTVEKSFVLAVKKYPRPDLEIVKIVPNPAGNDSDGETIDIKNNSGKKVDLEGWKIATGSGEKMYNHPINSELALAPGETKTVTREICKFSLNNKAGKVRLISPDGKIIDEAEYEKEKIADDEAYAKADGKWQWITPPEKENDVEKEVSNQNENKDNEGEVLGITAEKRILYTPAKTGYTSEDAFIMLSVFGFFQNIEEENCCKIRKPYPNPSYLLSI
ncbi:MAG: hypothetical protein COZ28_00820 [Candidatus Moranbacteria bacterium CG_4_10_14_3_um_filter_44_15]|nr:MAG: hypothetical protein COS72_04100 [Candidatus Moranbacteria bacterium CG06_land_8_20_14_3_00_43_56]PIW93595.1 MAG: hypothetical protein COZ87_00620 [Candidatus Moranbacteria bacterium CG_4_8_14_3_um_filter_43_15]PIX91034.1 MAG: hypothetical protein COZ28_00820 [Candidatus Moranbacteria bacterium CG_4_10_14_3_um_filter_44_15]PJA86099.1 MAG: hypothetical protein CO142_02140 [Candidatus Moranbacteria bacterium CG_4_9_14_3_um_filter_44_28]